MGCCSGYYGGCGSGTRNLYSEKINTISFIVLFSNDTYKNLNISNMWRKTGLSILNFAIASDVKQMPSNNQTTHLSYFLQK